MTDKMTPQPEQALAPAGIDWNAAILMATELGKDGVEVLERLHAIQRDERAHAAKSAFVRSMVALRAEMPPIKKTVPGAHGVTQKGGRTAGLYAPLDTITPVLDPLCARHGFTYDFDREVVEGRKDDYLVCVVTHEGGHEKRTRYPAPPGPENRGTNSLMAVAIGETYAKRYALVSAFGITTADPDEDGNTGLDRTREMSAEKISAEEAERIRARLKEIDRTEYAFLSYVSKVWGCEDPIMSLEDIPASHVEDAWRVKGMR